MEFTFDFIWKEHVSVPEVRQDRADVNTTSRVCFAGLIGKEDQKPAELHNDVSEIARKDFGEVRFVQDNEGRLRGRAVITTIGVYPYIKKDGTVEWELRHPDDVYDSNSLRSLELLPLTNDHPDEMVTKDNIQDLQVGHLGEFVLVDTMHGFITNSIVVTESVAVQDVNNGKRALSAGYKCDVVPEKGTWNGIPYTSRQKNIRYNHVSIVDRGRAGDDAVMKFDSFDGIQTFKQNPSVNVTDSNTDEEDAMGGENLKTVKIDGVDYQAESAVLTALHNAQQRADSVDTLNKQIETMKADTAKIEGERDSLKAKVDALEKQLESSIKTDDLEGIFQKRQKLDEAGKLAGIEDFEKLDVNGQMEAVVLKVSPETKAVLDAKKDSDTYSVYLESRFDSAIEILRKDGATLAQNLADGTGASQSVVNTDTSSEVRNDAENWKRLAESWKKEG